MKRRRRWKRKSGRAIASFIEYNLIDRIDLSEKLVTWLYQVHIHDELLFFVWICLGSCSLWPK